jgi:hypothetical protein
MFDGSRPFDLLIHVHRSTMLSSMGALVQGSSPRTNSLMQRDNYCQEPQQQQQQDCMRAILDGDVLLVLPTGTNKIIFHTPAVTRFAHSIPNVALTIVLLTYTALGRVLLFLTDAGEMSKKSTYSDGDLEQMVKIASARGENGLGPGNHRKLEAWFSELGISEKTVISAVRFVTNPDIGVKSTGDLLFLDDADLTELTGTIIKSKVGIGKFKSALSALRGPSAQSALAHYEAERERNHS